MVTFADLVEDVEPIEITGDTTQEINKAEVDSRLIKDGDLFIAVDGHVVDGLKYLNEAIANGAVAVIAGRPFTAKVPCKGVVKDIRVAVARIAARLHNYPSRDLKLIGVSGTNGKTTIIHLLKSILEKRLLPVGLIGTLGYIAGKHSFPAVNTTPGPIDLERLLTIMKNEQVRYVVMEVSSHALAQQRVSQLCFQVVGISNITQDHLDYHGDFENYRQTKARLLELVEGSDKWVVLNMDDPNYDYLLTRVNSSHMTFSLENNRAEVTLEKLQTGPEGSIFTLITPIGREEVNLQLLGRFNVENALCAAALALAVGLDPMNIAAGLSEMGYVPGRAQKIDAGQPFTVLIDYAHTPDALMRIGQAAREICEGNLVLLFGCGGDRDKTKRAPMGKAASAVADVVIVTSDNPRSEDPLSIIEDIKPGLNSSKLAIIEPERRRAIEQALSLCRQDDLLVIAGKGHEDYQIIGAKRIHFDDREVIENYLKGKE
ncbi:MAG: UDP-N-acetylmuramoyl-L-alanyl-D-glutamate--2,6-diaminopimelate ligase [candidate division Zixibacteria bacterium]|nr:UDP-N-acetylmuramoyl-L-alanyl-D-glutamate--2,6-diaminopimelate ligase [candidate division Zixibacteria bacterium]